MSKIYSDPDLLDLLRRAWEAQQANVAVQEREEAAAAARERVRLALLFNALLDRWGLPLAPTEPELHIGEAVLRYQRRYPGREVVEVLRPCPGCGDLQPLGDTLDSGTLYPLLMQEVNCCPECHGAELDREAAERVAALSPSLAEQLATLIRAIVREELGGPA